MPASYSIGGNTNQGLSIRQSGSNLPYIEKDGKPLLAFGCHFEHMLFDDFDFEAWTDWAVAHGINHCRTRLYHAQLGKYTPFHRNPDGKLDLTRWDESYWSRFHEIMSHMESYGFVMHMLIFPQGTGGYWWQGDNYYLPENNVHPETAFIRPERSTAGFWQCLAKGKNDLYEILTAIVWKLIDESARYDNVYYDLCHEPFLHAMKDDALEDMKVFVEETTGRFHDQYRKLRPDKTALLGIDTDFTPPGEMRDWLYAHEGFNLIIKGQNHDQFYSTTTEAMAIMERFKKPFCPQESLDPPGIILIPDIKHKNTLTYFESKDRIHIRKYVWRWIMTKSQLIDIYQKGLSKKDSERERYDPNGHNAFEDDAVIIRDFWNNIRDFPNLAYQGKVESGPGTVHRVLSSPEESIVYFSSIIGYEKITFRKQKAVITDLLLADGSYQAEIWIPGAPGGLLSESTIEVKNGIMALDLPEFTDDLVIHIISDNQ